MAWGRDCIGRGISECKNVSLRANSGLFLALESEYQNLVAVRPGLSPICRCPCPRSTPQNRYSSATPVKLTLTLSLTGASNLTLVALTSSPSVKFGVRS